MPTLTITLEDTYWSRGFFNIPRDFERFITSEEGTIDIYLGDSPEPLRGRVSRSANSNATPRVYGNKPLAEFFQRNCRRGGRLQVQVIAPTTLRLSPAE